MTEFRENRDRYRKSTKKDLKKALENITEENVNLQKTVTVLENEHQEETLKEKRLEQEVKALRQRISNMKMKKQQEEKRLRETIKQLKAELYDLGVPRHATINLSSLKDHAQGNTVRSSRLEEAKQEDFFGDIASVAGVAVYDRRIHRNTIATDKPSRHHSTSKRSKARREDPNARPRRRSTPLPSISQEEDFPHYVWKGQPKRSNHTFDEVDLAARAFLDVFSQFSPKALKTFWKNDEQTEIIDNELVLNVRHLPSFLHRLVVFTYLQDNPRRTRPSTRRTKALISLLKLRLRPYMRNRRHFTFEHFENFAHWLEKRKEVKKLKLPVTFSVQNSIGTNTGDPRRFLAIGSSCLIYSSTGRDWFEGEVTNIKYDEEGEWLVVRYFCKSKWIAKEVQRFSDLIHLFPQG